MCVSVGGRALKATKKRRISVHGRICISLLRIGNQGRVGIDFYAFCWKSQLNVTLIRSGPVWYKVRQN